MWIPSDMSDSSYWWVMGTDLPPTVSPHTLEDAPEVLVSLGSLGGGGGALTAAPRLGLRQNRHASRSRVASTGRAHDMGPVCSVPSVAATTHTDLLK